MNEKIKSILSITFLVIVGLFSVSAGFTLAATNQTTDLLVYIMNTAPAFQGGNVTVTPDPAYPNDTMTVKANVTDSNNDTLTVNCTYYNTTGSAQSPTVWLVYNGVSGLWENNTFQLSTSAGLGVWNVTCVASDNITTTSFTTNFTVAAFCEMALDQIPEDFGNTSVPVTDRRAENGTAETGYVGGAIKGFPLRVNNTGNCNNNYSISGNDLVGQLNGAYSIPVSNVGYALTSAAPTATLTGSFVQYSDTNAPGSMVNTFFWLSASNVPQQNYKGNVTIRSYQT